MNLSEHFAPGRRIEINGKAFQCGGRGSGGRLKLTYEARRSTVYMMPEKLNDLFLKGQARTLPDKELPGLESVAISGAILGDLSTLPDAEQAATQRRYDYVMAVRKVGLLALTQVRLDPVIAKEATTRGDEAAPHWRTVVTWVRAYENSRSVVTLVHERRGNGHSRLDSTIEGLITITLEERWLLRTRPSLKDALTQLKTKVAKENEFRDEGKHLQPPSYAALRRYVSRLDKFDVMCRRYGEEYARRWFKAYRMGRIASRALEIVEVDHTILDVEVTYLGILELGRPTITVVLDKYTRMILWLEILFEPPSYLSVMEGLRGAILPKDGYMQPLLEQGLVDHNWPCFGKPELLLLDNGKEFRGNDLKSACAHMEIDMQFCKPRQPWLKGAIERFLGTMKTSFIAKLPGRTFPIKEEQGDRRPSEMLIDLEDLRIALTKWVVDIYHQTPHGGTGLPPRLMWEKAMRNEKWY